MNDKYLNLCDTCKNTFAECAPLHITFGDGYGDDNVIACSSYEDEAKNYKEEEE